MLAATGAALAALSIPAAPAAASVRGAEKAVERRVERIDHQLVGSADCKRKGRARYSCDVTVYDNVTSKINVGSARVTQSGRRYYVSLSIDW
jgi:hypothetical protein